MYVMLKLKTPADTFANYPAESHPCTLVVLQGQTTRFCSFRHTRLWLLVRGPCLSRAWQGWKMHNNTIIHTRKYTILWWYARSRLCSNGLRLHAGTLPQPNGDHHADRPAEHWPTHDGGFVRCLTGSCCLTGSEDRSAMAPPSSKLRKIKMANSAIECKSSNARQGNHVERVWQALVSYVNAILSTSACTCCMNIVLLASNDRADRFYFFAFLSCFYRVYMLIVPIIYISIRRSDICLLHILISDSNIQTIVLLINLFAEFCF